MKPGVSAAEHGAEANPLTAVGVALNNVAVFGFVATGIPDLAARQAMQPATPFLP